MTEVTLRAQYVFSAEIVVAEVPGGFTAGPPLIPLVPDVPLLPSSVPAPVPPPLLPWLPGAEPDPLRSTETGILARLTAALLARPPLELTVIAVTNEDGVVTLDGQVESREVSDAAEAIAAGHPGVVGVVNGLQVGAERRLPDIGEVLERS